MLQGHTTLHEAVTKGYKEIVSSLCEKNVDINAVTYKVNAPTHSIRDKYVLLSNTKHVQTIW